MDVNNLLDYPGESDTCSEVQNLEEIVDTIGKNNVDDEVEDDTITLEQVTRKEALIASRTLHNFMIQFEKTTPELLDAIRKDERKEIGASIKRVRQIMKWNSTYLMLDTAQHFEIVFDRYDLDDSGLSTYLATNVCEADGSVAGGLENIVELHNHLKKCMENDDLALAKIVEKMKEKFVKYWGIPEKMNKLFFIASILDPRNNLAYAGDALEDMYGEEKGSKLKDELETYMKSLFAECEVLAEMTRDMLAILISSVASECAFSIGNRIIDSFRSLTLKLVQAFVCLQDWYRSEPLPVNVEEDFDDLMRLELGIFLCYAST
ncbi:uncharacterized protein LOC125845773 [Solanum stenotomum]|uniref:uncharacterized protein LOC125845773 n=1 Tax=Solanum stenotomum TaxID=172797 RepID=UPI0020D060A2|nr:uncharacterized protein LOC125845773 [Solanum stenotomum]